MWLGTAEKSLGGNPSVRHGEAGLELRNLELSRLVRSRLQPIQILSGVLVVRAENITVGTRIIIRRGVSVMLVMTVCG